MQQLVPRFRGGSHTVLRLLRMCLPIGSVLVLLLSPHLASAHTLHGAIPAGTVCTDSCEGGYQVYSDSGFNDVWGQFQVPCITSGDPIYIWVGMGGHVDAIESGDANTVGLSAGVEVSPTGTWLELYSSTGSHGSMAFGAVIPCGDTVQAQVTAPNSAYVEDITSGPNYGKILQRTLGSAVYNMDAKCAVQELNPNSTLANFGTVTFDNQCWVNDSNSGWQNFSSFQGSYLWLEDNNNTLMAGDPDANRDGLSTGVPESVQWYASN